MNGILIVLLIPCLLLAAYDFREIGSEAGIYVSIAPAFPKGKNIEFRIQDSSDIKAVINALMPFTSDAVDSSMVKKADFPAECNYPPNFGYLPKLAYPTIFIPSYMPRSKFVIGNQAVAFKNDGHSCRYMWDRNSKVEKLIISILSKDSTFNPVAIHQDTNGLNVMWIAVNKTVEFQLINAKSKVLASYQFDGMLGKVCLDYNKLKLEEGAYVLKSNLSGKTNVFRMPYFLSIFR